ncbi:uncharacterized protein LOC132274233 [Cornus florida]|uniref:uncharacterized protein LOC132274233 n=1 Tax=Cornus florida TaxID=4283 RepID=UPI0028A283C1|nr:uncharacterized protein LOC132274233 [Cornus florida]XP_059631452.1 uncharacterized protein LOC132274233 [Cornus florida]XP_059631453.1 uncharacterized protein LOC132274233 [Cornus florida]XP_059631454.1 uncharacterized protein LOC132274233 [Cornus florida]XP_059631455.1 uncharacterized protein LOC132274233 [Cornus florida]
MCVHLQEMRTIYICKSLISLSLNNSSHLNKTPISLFSLLFFSSSPKSPNAVADYLIERHKFSPETASKVSFSPRSPNLKRPETIDSILSFLEESGFSDTNLERVIKHAPQLLSANLELSIKPKFKFFQELGISSSDIVQIVSSDPRILTRVDSQLGPSILALKSVLVSNMDVSRVLKRSGHNLSQDWAKTMIPNIEFLKSCGISSSQITRRVYNSPTFCFLKPTRIRENVKRVDEMGFDRKSKMFLEAIRIISSMTKEKWELKLEVFKSLGFSEDDILSVFRRAPQLFGLSERKIKETTQLFLRTGKCDISYVVNNPELLCYSVENRTKPRLRVLEVLESRNLLLKKPSLGTVCKMTDKKFFEKYVVPHSNEVGELFVATRPR